MEHTITFETEFDQHVNEYEIVQTVLCEDGEWRKLGKVDYVGRQIDQEELDKVMNKLNEIKSKYASNSIEYAMIWLLIENFTVKYFSKESNINVVIDLIKNRIPYIIKSTTDGQQYLELQKKWISGFDQITAR